MNSNSSDKKLGVITDPFTPNKRLLFQILETPVEEKTNSGCIWCGQNLPTNKAHIFPKRIVKNINNKDNILEYSVCSNCNSLWSKKIEDWIFKYTPLARWSEIVIRKKGGFEKYNILYVYVEDIANWSLVRTNNNSYWLPAQLFVVDGELQVYGQDDSKNINVMTFLDLVNSSIKLGNYFVHIFEQFPKGFLPRAFFINDKLIITGRNAKTTNNFIKYLLHHNNIEDLKEQGTLILLEPPAANKVPEIIFKWSIKRYILFCVKIVLEGLCKLKGKKFVLKKCFDEVRNSFLQIQTFDNLNIKFIPNRGLQVFRLVPKGWISVGNEDMEGVKKILVKNFHFPNTHGIIIYKVESLLVAVVQIFNIDPVFLIIANYYEDFNETLYINYDYANDKSNFLRLLEGQEVVDTLKEAMESGQLDNF